MGTRKTIGRNPNWTEAEDKILREVYPKKGMKGCLAALPHRTKSACVNRINYIGLKLTKRPKLVTREQYKARKEWTPEEDEILFNTWPVNPDICLTLLSRTPAACKTRLYNLKLMRGIHTQTKQDAWTDTELLLLKKLYPMFGAEECAKVITTRTVDQITCRAHQLHLLHSTKPVKDLGTGIIYESAADAAKYTGRTLGSVYGLLNTKYKNKKFVYLTL